MAGRSKDKQDEPGRLYVLATPLGNLGDLSPRAMEILASVKTVACEDTRVSRRLLELAGSNAGLLSCHDHNERRASAGIVARLKRGDDVALLSDAGTPCISDPGYRVVCAVADAGLEVITVPGPSAVTALLSVSGLPTDRFSFEGFLPSSGSSRRRVFERLADAGGTAVFYESPRRVLALLDELAGQFDDPPVAVGRELTKLYEQVLRGPASEVAARLREQGPRGEFTVAVALPQAEKGMAAGELRAELARLLDAGLSRRDAAIALKSRGVSRSEVYRVADELADD